MKLNTKPLKDIEIGIPVLCAGVYYARVHKAELKPNKSGDGNNLVVMFKVLNPTVHLHATGEELENRGQVVMTRYISLKPTDKYDPDKSLKELAVAIKHPETEDFELSSLEGKLLKIKVAVSENRKDEATGNEYPPSNDIKGFSKIGDDDPFNPMF